MFLHFLFRGKEQRGQKVLTPLKCYNYVFRFALAMVSRNVSSERATLQSEYFFPDEGL